MKVNTRSDYRKRRHLRIRRHLRGTAARPRMCVFVSNKHMYVQFVDDEAAATLASASTAQAGEGARLNVETARQLGKRAADAARAKGIETVVFDRGGFRFAARIKALADAAREAGLTF